MDLTDNQTAMLICAGGLFLTWTLVSFGHALTRTDDSEQEASFRNQQGCEHEDPNADTKHVA